VWIQSVLLGQEEGVVHGNGAFYTRMALTLVDQVLSGTFKIPLQSALEGSSKRKRAKPDSSYGGEQPMLTTLKGLSHEIDFKNFNKN
jgi:hypothetical protein